MCERCKSQYDKQISGGKILIQKIKAKVVKYQSGATIEGDFYVDLKQTISNFIDRCIKSGADDYSLRTVGYYVGIIRDNKIIVRASFCTPDDYKHFCTCAGKDIACMKLFTDEDCETEDAGALAMQNTKLINGNGTCYLMPYTLAETKDYFKKRCLRYFKGYTFEGK